MPLISSHLYFAGNQLSDSLANEDQRDGFLIGSILPDIRYISGDNRGTTHFLLKDESDLSNKISLIKKENSSIADIAVKTGIVFHSFLDIWWRKQVYLASKSKFIGLALQIVDEEQAFSLFNRKAIIERIKKHGTVSFSNISELVVEKWISLVIDYLSQDQFDAKAIINLIARGKNYDTRISEEILGLVDVVKNDENTFNQITKLKEAGIPQKIKLHINGLWLG
ncbi:MAG: hypothetical protein ABIB61_01555 [Candidatus Shapirobacteria bacterium]